MKSSPAGPRKSQILVQLILNGSIIILNRQISIPGGFHMQLAFRCQLFCFAYFFASLFCFVYREVPCTMNLWVWLRALATEQTSRLPPLLPPRAPQSPRAPPPRRRRRCALSRRRRHGSGAPGQPSNRAGLSEINLTTRPVGRKRIRPPHKVNVNKLFVCFTSLSLPN